MKSVQKHSVALVAIIAACTSFVFGDWKRFGLALAAFIISIIAVIIRRKDEKRRIEEAAVIVATIALITTFVFINVGKHTTAK